MKKKRLASSTEFYGQCWFSYFKWYHHSLLLLQVDFHHEERSGKWSSTGCQINFTKIKCLFSSLILIWIPNSLSCSLYDNNGFDALNASIFFSMILICHASIWASVSRLEHAFSLHFSHFFFVLVNLQSFPMPDYTGIFSLQPMLFSGPCSWGASFLLMVVSSKTLPISSFSSIASVSLHVFNSWSFCSLCFIWYVSVTIITSQPLWVLTKEKSSIHRVTIGKEGYQGVAFIKWDPVIAKVKDLE